MTYQGWTLILVFTVLIVALAKPMGMWLFALYEGRRTPFHAVLGPIETGFYKLAGIDPNAEQGWRRYALHMLFFQLVTLLFTYAILRLQDVLPMNPRGLAAIGPDGAMNTAISFTTNTNWQWYSGEVAMSNLTQMLGLTIHNFLSAATGIAIAFAMFRGFARKQATGIGNFWADMTRVTLYLLLPLCIAYAIFLIASGVPQTFASLIDATTIEGVKQQIVVGPVASQEAIKMLGTNGGGFFNANSAHSLREPDGAHQSGADALDLLDRRRPGLVLRQGSQQYPSGLGDPRRDDGAVPSPGVAIVYWQEAAGTPMMHGLGIPGGNMEGKEVRFGLAAFGALRGHHHGGLVRRGQCHA